MTALHYLLNVLVAVEARNIITRQEHGYMQKNVCKCSDVGMDTHGVFTHLNNENLFKHATKKELKYTFMDVKNDYSKLGKYTFTIVTKPGILHTVIDGKTEVTRELNIGDFVICGPSKDIYSTTADRFFMSYTLNAEAIVKPLKKKIAVLTKALFKIFNIKQVFKYKDAYGAIVNVYPDDGIIEDKNPKTGKPEYWRIDKKVMKITYDFN